MERSKHHSFIKKSSRNKSANYRPVNLTSVICKVLESIIRDHMLDFLSNFKLINTSQDGLSKARFSHLSHLSLPSPCSEYRVLHRPFHLSRSVAHSSSVFQAFKSLLPVSFHHSFGLPLGRFPSIFISATARICSVSSLLLMCPNHSSLLRLLTVDTGPPLLLPRFPHFSGVLTGSCPLPIAPFSSMLLPHAFHL